MFLGHLPETVELSAKKNPSSFGTEKVGLKKSIPKSVFQSAPKERRRGRAEKRLSKRVLLESPFLLCSLKVFRTFQVF